MENKGHLFLGLEVVANICQILALLLQFLSIPMRLSSSSIFSPLAIAIGVAVVFAVLGWLLFVSRISPKFLLRSDTASRLVKLVTIGFVLLGCLVGLNAAVQVYSTLQADRVVVLVNDFYNSGNPNGADKTTSQMIYDKLKQTLEGAKDVEVVRRSEPVEGLNSQSAISIGRAHGATIVIWGWYTIRQNDVLVSPRFEVLTDYSISQPFQFGQQIIPRSSLESFNFEVKLSGDFSYLSAFTLGILRRRQQRYNDAISLLTKATSHGTSNSLIAEAYNIRGLSFDESGRSANAIQDFQNAIRLDPTNSLYYYNLGATQIDTRETEAAITNLKKATELDPNFASPLNSLGYIFHGKRDARSAEYYYQRAIQIAPSDKIYRQNIAILYSESGDYVRALEHLNIALKIYPTDGFLHASKTEILWKKGAISESLVESCFAIYYQQPALISLIFVGLVCFTLFVVVDIHFKHEPFKWLIVNASFAASSAIFWILGFQKPLNKKNQSNIVSKLLAPAVLMRLNAFLVVGKRSEAISLAEKATVWKVKSKDIFSILGVSYFEENKYGPAAGAFSEVLKLKKDDVLAHFGLGRIFLETGEIGNADEAILHFQKAASSLFEVAAWLWTGNLYWNYRHDLRGALVTWEKAVNKDPRYVIKMTEPGIKDTRLIRMPEEHFKLGLAYERIGEKENAVKAFELASILGAYPNLNDEARRRLKRLKSKVT